LFLWTCCKASSVDVFTGVGVPKEDAEISAQTLIASDLRGVESHASGG